MQIDQSTSPTLTGRLLTPREAEALLNVRKGFLAKDRMHSGSVPYLRLSKRVIRYRRADLENFIANAMATQ